MATYIYGPVQCTGVDSTTGQHEFSGRVVLDITQNVSANTSTVNSWRFEIYITRTIYISNYTATSNNAVNVWIDNRQVFSSANVGTVAMNNHYENSGSGPLVLAQSSTPIVLNHNDNGDRSLRVQATYTKNLAYMQSITVDQTKVLPHITRGTQITSVSNVSLGSAPSVVWTPTNASYGYKIKYECGSWNYTTDAIAPGSTSAYTYNSYSIPATVAGQITGSTSGSGTVTLITYTEAACTNELGRNSKSFTITVPNNSTYQPTASLSISAVNAFSTDLYLTGRTSFTYSCSATYKYNATLKSYSVTALDSSGNQVYTYSGTTATGSIPVFNTAGTATFNLTVTDSRGLSGSVSVTRTITAYSKPSITATATRGRLESNVFVVDEAEGTVVQINYTVSYTDLVKNDSHVNSTTVNVTKPDSSVVTVTGSPVYFGSYSVDNGYDFVLSVYDSVTGSSDVVTFTVHIVPAWYPIDVRKDGRGVVFGGVASNDYSKIDKVIVPGWDVEVTNKISGGEVNGNSVTAGTTDKGVLTANGLEFKDQYNSVTGKMTSDSFGVLFGVINFPNAGTDVITRQSSGNYLQMNVTNALGKNIKGVINVVPRGTDIMVTHWTNNGTASSYYIRIVKVSGTFASTDNIDFEVYALPA